MKFDLKQMQDVLEHELGIEELRENKSFQQFWETGEYYQRFGEKYLVIRHYSSPEEWVIEGLFQSSWLSIVQWTNNPALRLQVVTGEVEHPNRKLAEHIHVFFRQEEEKNKLLSLLSNKEWQLSDFTRERIAIELNNTPYYEYMRLEDELQKQCLETTGQRIYLEREGEMLYVSANELSAQLIVKVRELMPNVVCVLSNKKDG